MAISYNGLWKILIDNGMKKGDLKRRTGISSGTIAKMTNGEAVKPQKETYERLIQIEDNKLDGLISKLYGAENCRREDLDEE